MEFKLTWWRGAEVKVQIEEYTTIDLTIRLSTSDSGSQVQHRQLRILTQNQTGEEMKATLLLCWSVPNVAVFETILTYQLQPESLLTFPTTSGYEILLSLKSRVIEPFLE